MKVIFTGDWHFGHANNSTIHNEHLMHFIRDMVDYANENSIGAIVQMGDWFDSRDKIDVRTLNYGIDAAKYIKETFKGQFIVLAGNHDIYYKERTDVSSTKSLAPYCDFYVEDNTFIELGGVMTLVTPWIRDPEHWDQTVEDSKKADYMFAHHEFNGFAMNDWYIMENGHSHKAFKHMKRVMTGHYHGRQIKDNTIYPGSPFPFDFNDANDDERGFGVIDLTTNDVHFVDWGVVKIRSLSYDDFMEQKDTFDANTRIRVEMPDNATDEQLEEVQSILDSANIGASKIKYTGSKLREIIEADVEVTEVENIDESVLKSFDNVNYASEDIDAELLKRLYKKAMEYQTQEESE